MFEVDRVYSSIDPRTGKCGWYFQAREGDSGPYETRAEAQAMLKEYIQECIEMGMTGGRKPGEKTGKPFDASGHQPKFKYTGRKRWYG